MNIKKKVLIFLLVFALLPYISAQYSTSLSIFDAENDSESEAQSNDSRVYVGEWTVFYANYSSDDGYDLGPVLWRNPTDLGSVYSVAAFDYDNDGNKTDFVFSEWDDIYAYYSNGTQIWRSSNGNFDAAYDIATGDFNNDSQKEVAFISSRGEFFVLNGSNGSVIFQSTDYYTGYSLANGDVDDDGAQDDFVIGARDVLGGTADNYGIVAIIYNDSSGNFEEFWTANDGSSYIYEVDISEVTGTNLVAFTDYSGGHAVVYYGNGTQKWITSDRGTGYSIEFFDQDSDGEEDEVIMGESSELRVYNDTGSESVKTEPYGAEFEVGKIDLDGDGIYDDILIGSDYSTVHAYNSDLSLAWTFNPPHKSYESFSFSNSLYSMKIGDINNDSLDEIIIGGRGQRYWILNLSGEIIGKYYYGFEESTYEGDNLGGSYSESSGIDILDDTNGDGIKEIVFVRTNGFVYVGQQSMCRITIDGNYREEYMYYNHSSKLWEYYHYFDDTGFNKSILDNRTFNWSVRCEKGGYENQGSLVSNITIYLKNSSLDIFDQEDDDENKAGWLSEDVITENETTWFFANYTDLEINESLKNLVFDVKWYSDIGETRYDTVAFDYDGDGLKESFAYAAIDAIYAYDADGTLLWMRGDSYYDYSYMLKSGDFNNDSKMEIVGVSSAGYLFVLNGSDGSELFQSGDYGTCYSLDSGDINDNNVDDLVIGCTDVNQTGGTNYGIVVFSYNFTTSNFDNIWKAEDALSYVFDVKISEISGDENLVGFIDRSGKTGYVYYGNGTKAWQTSTHPSTVESLEFFDYNKDGKEDELIIGEYSENYIYNSSGNIINHTLPIRSIYEIESLDYNNDGYKDEYIYFENYFLRVLNSSGSEQWSYEVPVNYASLNLKDINNDGELEIILGSHQGLIYVLNKTGSLIYRINTLFSQTMDETETNWFGYYYYGSGAGIDISDDINGSIYINFESGTSNVGVIEIYPKCMIYFNDSISAKMYYNISAGLYYYNRSFSSSGAYEWNTTCKSKNHVTRTSGLKTININTEPSFISISNFPDALDDLDPNVTIVVTVNISDINGNFDSAILQWKNVSDSGWINVTMENTTAKGSYTLVNASFTPSYLVQSNYTYRIWANDSEGASGYSSNVSLNVSWDCTWQVTPDLGAIAGWDENKWVGNITINNTGDAQYDNNCSLSFHLVSSLAVGRIYFNDWGLNSVYDYYDTSSVSVKSNTTVRINSTFLAEVKQEDVVITVTEPYSRSETSSRNTTATIVSNEAGPYLYQKITSSPVSVYLTSSNSTPGNFSLQTYLRNLMGGDTVNATNTAYNLSFNWSLPSGLTNISGNLSTNFTNITDNNLYYNPVNVSFSNLASITSGVKTVYIYGQGYNSSGDLIEDADNNTLLTEQANITFLCYNTSDGVCVADCGYTQDSDCAQEVVTETVSGGGGGGGGAGAGDQKYEKSEAIFELLRGEEQEFQLEIKNNYNGYKRDIKITVSGINSDYIEIIPEEISEIGPKSSKNITIRIIAPAYFTKGEYRLIFYISGKLVSNTTTPFSERKVVTLHIVEVLRENADDMLDQIEQMVQKMNESNMVVKGVVELFEQVKLDYNEINFLGVKNNYEKIKEIYESAFESLEIMTDLKEKIEDAERRGIEIIETKKILYIAEAAFNRGDYLIALEKLEDAKLTYAIETKGEFSILYTIKNHPYQTLLALIGIGAFGFGSSLAVRFRMYKRKLKMFKEEEKLLLELMRVVQKECFENNKMSIEEYEEAMNQYEKKLSEAVEDKIRVETKISNLLKLKGKKKALLDEQKGLVNLMKEHQEKYLGEGKIETRVYETMMKSCSTKLSEVEEKLTFLEAQGVLKENKLFRRILRRIFKR